jgi:hypothetical protein
VDERVILLLCMDSEWKMQQYLYVKDNGIVIYFDMILNNKEKYLKQKKRPLF